MARSVQASRAARLIARLDRSFRPRTYWTSFDADDRAARDARAARVHRRAQGILIRSISRSRPRVLIPRPETEIVVEAALEVSAPTRPTAHVLDIGTGSGAIAIAIAANAPERANHRDRYLSRRACGCAAQRAAPSVRGSRDVQARPTASISSTEARRCDFRSDRLESAVSGRGARSQRWSPRSRDFEPRVALSCGTDGLRVLSPNRRRRAARISPATAR